MSGWTITIAPGNPEESSSIRYEGIPPEIVHKVLLELVSFHMSRATPATDERVHFEVEGYIKPGIGALCGTKDWRHLTTEREKVDCRECHSEFVSREFLINLSERKS